MQFYFPLYAFLSVLRCEQVTDEIRAKLRKLHLQYAPSPTGKIEERTQKVRDRLAELTYVEGQRELDPGRGPWSQIVFDEIGAKDEISRAAWQGLLEHCGALEQAVPGAKWKKRSHEFTVALGQAEVGAALQSWLALGPTPGQPPEARSPIEDSPYQRGVVWLLALTGGSEYAATIGDLGAACLRKVPMLGAVSQKVGFACVQALGSMDCNEAVSQLARLRTRVKYSVAQRLIEKSLKEAAERSGLAVEELEDLAVPQYPVDSEGKTEIAVGEARATVQLSADGNVTATWRNAEGKILKAVPASIKKAFPKEVKSVAALAKELEQAFVTQRHRLESSFVSPRGISFGHWRQYFIDHSFLGLLGRRLIWMFGNGQGWEQSALYCDGEFRDSRAEVVDVSRATNVRLWHPLSSEARELGAWRDRIFALGVRQPFRQAFREFYEVTDDERQTKMYSNRFAGILMRQHQFSSLCRSRGWRYRLMGSGFDGFNVPTKLLASWNMHAELYVDLSADRRPSVADSALNEQSHAGINVFLGSDQVRFYRDRREIAIEDVPAIVYSEVMRDVDLFTSVSAVGPDETWSDQGDRGTGVLPSRADGHDLADVIALRIEMLARILPLTKIAPQCKIEKPWLVVKGQLGTYRIQIVWGGVLRVTDSGVRELNISPKLLERGDIDFAAFPIELDQRARTILRKAYLLANDWHIDSPELIQQLM